MPKLLSVISVFSVPLLGLGLLVWSLGAAGSLGEERSVTDTAQPHVRMSAAFNENRLLVLSRQYGHYSRCCRYLSQTHTTRERFLAAENVAAAIQEYNEVAQDTDPSAFASTSLPKRLPRP